MLYLPHKGITRFLGLWFGVCVATTFYHSFLNLSTPDFLRNFGGSCYFTEILMLLMYQDKEAPTTPGASAPLRTGGCCPPFGGSVAQILVAYTLPGLPPSSVVACAPMIKKWGAICPPKPPRTSSGKDIKVRTNPVGSAPRGHRVNRQALFPCSHG